jgi:hypothetical protein
MLGTPKKGRCFQRPSREVVLQSEPEHAWGWLIPLYCNPLNRYAAFTPRRKLATS